MQIGMNGSVAHVLTNDKIEDKRDCLGKIVKQDVKDCVTLTGAAAGAAGAAAVATAKSGKVATAFKSLQSKAGAALSKVSVEGTNLKEIIKGTKLYTKFSALPVPAKAAVAAGAAFLAIAGPIAALGTAKKEGYIEGQYETK